MKKSHIIIIIIVILVIAGALIMGRGGLTSITEQQPVSLNEPLVLPENTATITDGNFSVAQGSTVNWVSNKTQIPKWIDRGTIGISSGSFVVSAGIPVAGTFVFDMNTIRSSKTGKGDDQASLDQLSKHLMSADWFNATQYPESRFIITRVTPLGDANVDHKYAIKGRLTIKDITQEVESEALLYKKDGQLFVQGSFNIDRTLWDIRFGSAKFFDNLKDNVISDMFVINYNVPFTQVQ